MEQKLKYQNKCIDCGKRFGSPIYSNMIKIGVVEKVNVFPWCRQCDEKHFLEEEI